MSKLDQMQKTGWGRRAKIAGSVGVGVVVMRLHESALERLKAICGPTTGLRSLLVKSQIVWRWSSRDLVLDFSAENVADFERRVRCVIYGSLGFKQIYAGPYLHNHWVWDLKIEDCSVS